MFLGTSTRMVTATCALRSYALGGDSDNAPCPQSWFTSTKQRHLGEKLSMFLLAALQLFSTEFIDSNIQNSRRTRTAAP